MAVIDKRGLELRRSDDLTRLAVILSSFALGMAVTAPAFSQTETSLPVATMAKPAKAFKVLAPSDVDPSTLLAPPAKDGSDEQKGELQEVLRLYRTTGPERRAQAEWDDKHEDSQIFTATLGPAFDLAKLPRTAALLKLVENEQSVAATAGKRYFLRMRPWAMDASIKPCDYKPGANPKTSFPSGHATLGYSVSYVLAQLIPEKSQALLDRAREYAFSRQICGDHYASDTEASHVLGVTVGQKLMAHPMLQGDISLARDELRSAGLTTR